MRSLLHQLAFGIWAIRPEAVSVYMPQLDDIVQGRRLIVAEEPKEDAPEVVANIHFVTMEGNELQLRSDNPVAPSEGLVAVVHITGAIMKEDFCGDMGMMSLAKWYASFDSTPEVLGIVEVMDSPGGNGYGMSALAIQKERMTKPVVTLVNHGMCCSAAYGIAATSTQVFSTTESDEVGSIGTYMAIRDFSKMEEQRGIKTHTILATRSTKKLSAYQEALKADNTDPNDPHYKKLRETRVDPFNEAFITLVQRNRPQVKDADGVFEGQVFTAKKAMELGLIDRTGATMNDAIAAVRELAMKLKPANNN